MDNKVFKEQMDRIIETFGQQNYGRERMKMIHKELQPLTNDELKWVIDHLIATVPTKYPPLVPRFLEAKCEAIKRRFNGEVQQVTQRLDSRGGLEEELKKRGAKSLLDAVLKPK